MTLESIQLFLSNVYSYAQLMTAVIGLLAIVIPILKTYSFYYDLIDLLSGLLDAALDRLSRFDLLPSFLNGAITTSYDSQESVVCINDMNISEVTAITAGLVNTGNSCFLNSVLQALSSLPRLHTYLNNPQRQTQPVSRSLLKTIRLLSRSLDRRTAFRPVDIVTALTTHHNVIINRDQQDAQEFFQLLSGAIDTECHRLFTAKSGIESLLSTKTPSSGSPSSPFTGLLASRLSCMQCGYTEAIRHFSFNNIQLMLPNAYTTTLDECLRQFTSIEYLQDATCRRCSLLSTHRHLSAEISKMKAADMHKKKKKKRRLETLEERCRIIERHLRSRRIENKLGEEDGQGEQWIQKTVSRLTSKQVMFAKPPKILCLHLSRSAFHPSGAVYKNGCRILFPEYLDLSAYTTNGTLSTQPNMPISSSLSSETKNISINNTAHYRLMSTIVHFGSHSYGHYVAFKRRIIADHCVCAHCSSTSSMNEEIQECWNNNNDTWYRISDTKVDTCSFDYVQQSNPYMLLYELMDEDDSMVNELNVADDEEEDEQKEAIPITTIEDDEEDQEEEDEAIKIANALLMEDKALRQHEAEYAAATATAAAAAATAATSTTGRRGWSTTEEQNQQRPPTLMSF
ncbi:cysteine proteinase [Lichtheimia hyalospora FSU 10163]|nr:cysteine proteinase [Lichtheimia hyalospora FSU 10163]